MKRDYSEFPDDDNGAVLWALRSKGDALTEPREVDFTVILPSEDAAAQFAAAWSKDYRVEMEEIEEKHDDGLDWEVIVYVDMVPTHASVTTLENTLNEQAESFGGRASGWSSIFVPSGELTEPVVDDLWCNYLAEYDALPGSIRVNMALKNHAPIADCPILVMTGVSYESGGDDPGLKLPDFDDLEIMNELNAKRVELVTSLASAIYVGAFLHENQQVDYFYVADADGLEAALADFYEQECPERRYTFKSQSDPEWEAYLKFLYPNEATTEHYRAELEESGAIDPETKE